MIKNNKEYKKLYLDLEKRFDRFVKHKKHHIKRCSYCRGWYKEILEETKKIKDKQVRDSLTEVWETLWVNNCMDFDIIATTFEANKK